MEAPRMEAPRMEAPHGGPTWRPQAAGPAWRSVLMHGSPANGGPHGGAPHACFVAAPHAMA